MSPDTTTKLLFACALKHLHLFLVENGAKVVFCARGVGEALEAELNKAGPGSCKFVTCDISKDDNIKECGVTPLTNPLMTPSAEEFRDLFESEPHQLLLGFKICAAVPTTASGKHHKCLQSSGNHRSEKCCTICCHQGGDHLHDKGDGCG
ncbi:hypothetical protein KUCAC02_007376 [Chaenocephalus aceratus]|uniref:Uncharacterized protein n=1 Tax=Chaenocephalus aceratus TaxID=36190 RepID=A0ACB9X667_CHAAC|nr:hypothetical protein KUCAC02_007376 [Chaenocephalus aceratus]